MTDPSGQAEGYGFGGTLILAQLVPGTYLLTVSGWDQDQAAGISYQVGLTFGSQDDNAPPLLSGPAPAVAIQLASVAPPSTPRRRRRSHRRRRWRTRPSRRRWRILRARRSR